MEEAIQRVLMFFVLPLWIAAGFADFLCHRRTQIAERAGAKESWIHLLMFSQVGLAILMAVFLQVNALTLLALVLLFVSHHLTAYWDLHYAGGVRTIGPTEQQIHSVLEMMPLFALIAVVLMNWNVAMQAVGLQDGEREWHLALRSPTQPTWYLWTVGTGVVLFSIVPYLIELRDGLRADRAKRLGSAKTG